MHTSHVVHYSMQPRTAVACIFAIKYAGLLLYAIETRRRRSACSNCEPSLTPPFVRPYSTSRTRISQLVTSNKFYAYNRSLYEPMPNQSDHKNSGLNNFTGYFTPCFRRVAWNSQMSETVKCWSFTKALHLFLYSTKQNIRSPLKR